MSTIEDRLRAATRAAAQTVAPGSTPPPPALPARQRLVPAARPRRGPGWPGWMAPLVAAVAVTAAIATSVVVSGALSLGHARSPSQAGAGRTGTVALHPAPAAPPGIPAYDVALAPGPDAGQSTRAVVRATATGAVLATVRPPRPYATFTWVTGAADDRTFVLAAQPAGQPTASGRVVMKFFALRLDPAAGTAKLTGLPTPTVSGTWIQAEGLALSPDGGKLAVALSRAARSAIEVFDLAGGPSREWKATLPGGTVVGTTLLGANALSWAADGRTLAFDAYGPAGVEVHALDTAAPATSLLNQQAHHDLPPLAHHRLSLWQRTHHARRCQDHRHGGSQPANRHPGTSQAVLRHRRKVARRPGHPALPEGRDHRVAGRAVVESLRVAADHLDHEAGRGTQQNGGLTPREIGTVTARPLRAAAWNPRRPKARLVIGGANPRICWDGSHAPARRSGRPDRVVRRRWTVNRVEGQLQPQPGDRLRCAKRWIRAELDQVRAWSWS